jgi:transcriptional regulator with PAS, ATPase and Fis domain
MVVAAVNAIENLLKVQHELRYRTTIMESISDGLVAIDCNMNIKQFNQAAAKLLKSSNLKNKQVEEIFGKRNLALFVNALKGRKITDQEIDIPTKAGKVCCTATVRSIVGKDGRSNGIVLILNEFARTRRLVNRMFGAQAKFTFDDIIGKNEKLVKAINIARTAAGSNSNILLLGESGTGKDVFAQAIHNESNRARGPFVAINCAAIPRELISSELFGYVEGAFTGAKRGGNPGKFELADGGTLFLDEIGEMPLDLQTMLLRVLEQRFVVRIGGQEVIPVDVRIIAATNRDLLAEVEKGNFRKDLYYRLNVVNINLIPLRERKDDIPILVEYFLKRLEQTLGKHFTHIQPEVWKVFQAYHWPGNIRELQNVLERAANIATGDVLSVEHLPPELIEKNINSNKESHLPLEQYEKKIIINLLKEYKGNISKAAARLGIARSTLYRKINKFGIDRNVYC